MEEQFDPPPPLLREFWVTPEFVVDLSKGGTFKVDGCVLPADAMVRLDLTRWDERLKRLVIVVQSARFPDVVEELKSPRFTRL